MVKLDAEQQHIAVIGAGVIGLTTALLLQKEGYCVTLFDGQGIAQGASSGNAGHFATEQVFPLSDPALLSQLPRMLLDPLGPFKIQPNYLCKAVPWFLRFMLEMTQRNRQNNSEAIMALNSHAIASWQRLISDIETDSGLTMQGSMVTYENTSQESILKTMALYKTKGVDVEYLDSEAVRQIEPLLNSNIKGALLFNSVAHTVNPGKLCQDIAEYFLNQGGTFIKENITCVTQDNRPVIHTTVKPYQVDKVVLCVGAHSKKLVADLGYKVPLETERGYHLMLPIQVGIKRPVASDDRKFIMTPMREGLRLAGTVEFGGLENLPDYRRSEILLTHAKAMFVDIPELAQLSLAQLSPQARWMGLRPSLPDSVPIIDKSPLNENILFNFGHQHLGLTWAAISAELIVQLVSNDTGLIDMTPYRVDRFKLCL
ncbi:FAD-binding oxidoreductase [Psychrobium sp. 1_MG-2023]|uniref:NAD(P)/FAD-dependent oxidoreductase n=1 Tax=Psychrobium sp. 1_MG-2023 TaxID=3062624 RepID=UPI000C33E0D9|nr:FAD-dependent oxidoreductase [Psychrobium sp. 1_MG-2023]MDP2562501.1 FAD-dependent oxidoreductase [Psychrobium sp. 1_MG-2023]PKF54334.1 hypothetical protein CW748_16535 [Alteromonadales bacterium alter-6D02]